KTEEPKALLSVDSMLNWSDHEGEDVENNAARPMIRPISHYFQHFSRPGYFNHISMDEGRWGTAVKPSTGCSWRMQRPHRQ
ncbi:hypothetical protein Tco_0479914, partial [Tanacetum coccineum]